jgi:hypothetical protein
LFVCVCVCVCCEMTYRASGDHCWPKITRVLVFLCDSFSFQVSKFSKVQR